MKNRCVLKFHIFNSHHIKELQKQKTKKEKLLKKEENKSL